MRQADARAPDVETVVFRTAVPNDAVSLARQLRPSDRAEAEALSGEGCEAVLQHGVSHSAPCLCATFAGEIVAMFGVVPDRSGVGRIWMLGTAFVDRHPLMLFREAAKWTQRFLEEYEVLWNYAAVSDERRLAWLQGCGFGIVQKGIKHGPRGTLCALFMRGRAWPQPC